MIFSSFFCWDKFNLYIFALAKQKRQRSFFKQFLKTFLLSSSDNYRNG